MEFRANGNNPWRVRLITLYCQCSWEIMIKNLPPVTSTEAEAQIAFRRGVAMEAALLSGYGQTAGVMGIALVGACSVLWL